jgi:predicted ATPase/DNA-binding SARP family transcriptional activator
MSHLSLRVLGPPHITLDGQSLTTLAYDKVWALLVYLALAADRAHRRTVLAGLLWPDQPEPVARTNLRQALARLRQALDDRQATPPFLLVDREWIQFNAASDHDCDAAEFSALLATCATHAHRQDATCAACAEWRAAAIAHYRGPLLDKFWIGDSDLFEEWTTVTRERLHQQALAALGALALYHERRGDYAEALRFNLRQLELGPWREEAHRQAMRVLALNGQRSAALAQYERCRGMLAAELGVEPAPETTTLYERIRANELDAPGSASGLALPATRPHNLPVQPTPFLGRQHELATLSEYLINPQCRLVTLVGPGGIGKTRLALQAATEQVDAFANGVTFVELAPLASAELIAPTLAAALRLTLSGPTEPQTQVLNYLRQKEVLLVLDNFEHLLPSATPLEPGAESNHGLGLLADILRQAPGVTMLVTSRERLNLHGEWLFEVGALEMPSTAANQPGDGEEAPLEAYSAPALFLQTARRVQKAFRPTPADQAAIVRICHLVEGMPLALELAAAWVRVLSCREIAHEIEQGVELLTTTLRDLPDRHRSLQAVFDHSWQLLSSEEQHAFVRCSVFRGGFTREAAAEVAGALLPLLTALVDKSLLRRNRQGRYAIHELARQYAAQRLAEAQQEAQARNRHLTFFMYLSEAAEPELRSGRQAAQWHDRIEVEHDNLRAALDWSFTDGEFEPGLRMVGALWNFWMNRGHAHEGQTQAERFLTRPEAATPTYTRSKALHTAGVCAFYQGHSRASAALLAEAIAISRALGPGRLYRLAHALIAQGYTMLDLHDLDAVQALNEEVLVLNHELQDAWIRGHALNQLGILDRYRGDMAKAQQRFLESFASFQADGHSVMHGTALLNLGIVLYEQGDFTAAYGHFTQSLAIFEELDDKKRSSTALRLLGNLAMVQGNYQDAEEFLARACTFTREVGNASDLVKTLHLMGRLAQRQGDYLRAHALHWESLTLCLETGHQGYVAHILRAFACLAGGQGQAERAALLFGAADARFAAAHLPFDLPNVLYDPSLRTEHERLVAETRTDLGEAAFAAAWAKGQAMSLEQAVEHAVGERTNRIHPHLEGAKP